MSTLGQVSSLESSSLVTHATARPRPRTGTPRPLIPGAGRLAVAETAFALGSLLAIVFLRNIASMPQGFDSFLSMRITLRNLLFVLILGTGWPAIFRLCGLYTAALIRRAADERVRVWTACTFGTALALVLSSSRSVAAWQLFAFWGATTVGTLAIRQIRRSIIASGSTTTRVLFVGSGIRAARMWQQLVRDPQVKYEVVGFVDTHHSVPATDEIARRSVGTLDQLEPMLMHQAIDEVHVALPVKSRYREIQETLLVCERVGVRTKYQADLFDTEVAWARYDDADSPVVTMHVVPDDYRLLMKRVIDIVGATAAIVLGAPLMLAVAIAIKVTSPGPVLFAQERYGLNRRRFRMFKFRTMVTDAERLQPMLEGRNEVEGPVFKIADDPRVTPLGRWLRRTSIDELPQLMNVVRGEMSLVGPRPLPLRDVRRFTRASDMRRFSVRPGLTCLWQVSGRSALGFTEWIRLDLKYIDGWSLWLDALILLRTVPAVLRRTGAE